MVNQTCLESIVRFIDDKQLRPMKEWSRRSVGRYYKPSTYMVHLIRNIRKILNWISGFDIIEMLKTILKKREIEVITDSRPEKRALKNLATCYKRTCLIERFHFARALKTARIKYAVARKYGFKISSKLWKECNDGRDFRKTGSGAAISRQLQESIREYLIERSNIGANRLIKNKNPKDENYGQKVPVRYLDDNKIELYKTFPFREQLHYSTFRRYLNASGEFKRPFRWTDLCDYCENAKQIKTRLIRLLEERLYTWEESFDFRKVKDFLETHANELVLQLKGEKNRERANQIENELQVFRGAINDVRDYETIQFHRNIAFCQRTVYNNHRQNVNELRGKIMIELDYKQKIVIGISPRQVNVEFYEPIKRSCLGFGIYYVDEATNEIKLINFDIISSDLTDDSFATVRGFRLLREQAFFREIEKTNYIVWADCGKHFRCSFVVGYLFDELAKENIKVSLNFFAEKHGKSTRDIHFSNISEFVKTESLKKRLVCTQDVVDAINMGQARANENQIYLPANRRKYVTTYAIGLDLATEQRMYENFNKGSSVTIEQIESFYNYQNTDGTLKTSVLSNQSELIEIPKQKLEELARKPNLEIEDEKIVQDDRELAKKITTLKLKHIRINVAFKEMEKQRKNLNNEAAQPLPQPNNVVAQAQPQNIAINQPLYDFFSTVQEEVSAQTAARAALNPVQKPPFCLEFAKGKKQPCLECNQPCLYTLQVILDDRRPIGQKELNKELQLHNHPSCRIIKERGGTRQRSTWESAMELADHYVYAHKLVRPLI